MNWPKEIWDKVFSDGKTYWQIGDTETKEILSRFPEASTALDMACGSGELAFRLVGSGLKVDAMDFSFVAIKKAREQAKILGLSNISFLISDIENDDLQKNYDLIFIKLAFAFVEEKEKFLERIKGHAKQGLVIITPVMEQDKEYSEKMLNISVALDEMERLLKKSFGSYEVFSCQQLPDGSDVRAFIVKTL